MHNGKITPIQYVLEFTPLEFETSNIKKTKDHKKIIIKT